MRTTVTFDPDVAAKIKAEMRRSGDSFKDVVNRLVRKGSEAASVRQETVFQVDALPMGEKPGLNYDNIGELLEQLEGPFHK